MTSRSIRRALWGLAGLAFLLHNDLWLWNESRMVLGLPIGLLYHVVFCLGVVVLMALLVRLAWPRHLP